MEEKNITVPYIVFESAMDRADRRDKRYIAVIIVLIVMLVLTNLAWLIVWNQYDYVDDYIEVDGGQSGIANYIGEDGDINNGSYSKENSQTDSP